MEYLKKLFGLSVYTTLPRRESTFISLILFILIFVGYLAVAQLRHQANPQDKIVPGLAQLRDGINQVMSPDANGNITLVGDTVASLERLFVGVIIGLVVSLVVGITVAVFPLLEALIFRFILYFGKIPPLALLPIIFIFSGLGETTKILLIFIGIAPTITLDIYFKVKSLPPEEFIKALTFGARPFTIMRRVVLPQIMPAALTSLRLQLLNAWLFLIAAEAIAASSGLGYRIFLVRRYLAMNVIIPYVLWIAILSFGFDALLAWWIKRRYRWYNQH